MAESAIETRIRQILRDTTAPYVFAADQVTAAWKGQLERITERALRVSAYKYRLPEADRFASSWIDNAYTVEVDGTETTPSAVDGVAREITFATAVDEDAIVTVEGWRVNLYYAAADVLVAQANYSASSGQVMQQGSLKVAQSESAAQGYADRADELRRRGMPRSISLGGLR